MTELTLDDIADLRAYEREREEFRARIIELKKLRRVSVGPFVTLVFENRDTVRFQIQEMARVERLISDEAIQAELETYNPLIPGDGELSATLFIELVDKAELERWLPKLVGIEWAAELRLGTGPDDVVRCRPESAHEERLTREETTASVHYVRFPLSEPQIERFAAGPARLAIAHESYEHETELSDVTRRSLTVDLGA